MQLSVELKQSQNLSPQMIQALSVLQMGNLELQQYVEKILLENPTLELENERKPDLQSELLEKTKWILGSDRQNRWYQKEDAQDFTELIAAPMEETLYDHLRDQLNMEQLSGRLGLAVDCVLSGLDKNGYLDETTAELADRCGQTVDIVMQAENLIRSLEPAGVAARTLSQCLAIQLERAGETGLVLTIVKNHLNDIAKNQYHRIAKETGASRLEIQNACNQIRALNPRPGAAYAPREAPGYLIPDLLISELNGALVITSGDNFLPELKISSYYQKLMESTEEKEVRDYLADRVRQAYCLIKNIDQRRNTLLACTRIIVDRQEEFFRSAAGNLKPMTLADVATEAGVHESTVSRAIKGKYVQCVRGVFPLSYFFSRSLAAENTGEVSVKTVMSAIRKLIDSEDKKKPLSDQRICDLLTAQGVVLSRRTVAKYRETMRIAPASGRREF